MAPTDDAQKINRLNALDFNDLVIAWKAWKGKHMIKGDRGKPAKNPLMLKLVSLLYFGVPTFWELSTNLPSFDMNECLYSVHLKLLLVS